MIPFSILYQDYFTMLKIIRGRRKREKPILSIYCQQASIKHPVVIREKNVLFGNTTLDI